MIDKKILEIAERSKNIIVDDLSEYFMQQEYYQQLESDEVASTAGMHLKLRSILIKEDTCIESIHSVDYCSLSFTVGDGSKLFIRTGELLEYENYLLAKLLLKYEMVNV